MEISFQSHKLEKEFASEKALKKAYGNRANTIQRRMTQLRHIPCLDDMRLMPGKCRQMVGDLRGTFAVSIDDHYRLLFEVKQEPIPRLPDGGIDWKAVTEICILRIEDYHGN